MKRILILFLLLAPFLSPAQDIPPRPNPPRLVNDLAGSMTPDQVQALERKLVSYDDSTSTQIVIVTKDDISGGIEDYALKILRDWGVGNKKTNNGVVIVADIKNRKITIQTGYGMEGSITDLVAKSIIDREIAPNFRASNYFRGFDEATDAIIRAAAGTYKAPEGYSDRRGRSKGEGGGFFRIIVIIFIIILVLSRMGGGGGGGGRRRGGLGGALPWIIAGSSGWGGGSSGGFGGGGGGGFGGFGGGSGGGGGASGSW